jgi:transcription antitermination factor NusG
MVKYTRGVRRFVGDRSGIPYIVDESIIEFIRSRMQNGFVHFDSPELAQGENVLITDGPFSGLTGIFMGEIKPSERVIILLNTIQYQAKVKIPKEFITTKSLSFPKDQL